LEIGVREDLLVARACAGDEDAFARLYELSVGRVHALCLRMARDRVRAQELTQDVFVRVWERLTAFRGESAFSSWVYRIAVNVVIDTQRKERRELAQLGEGDDAIAEVHAVSGDPVAWLDVESGLRELPEGARLMLLLYAVDGYRYDEVAALTGTAVGTVKAQIHRARRLLAAHLER
jgi:RNA polymerase sigma-70 factor (ECF subfamily)